MQIRTNDHPAMVYITENESHALFTAYNHTREDFLRKFVHIENPERAERFGRRLVVNGRGAEEGFVPRSPWTEFYLTLAMLGLAELKDMERYILLCGHTTLEHIKNLKCVIGKVTPVGFRN